MANFRTHISVAAAASGLLATLYLGAEVINPTEVVILWAAGTLGGILPDIDSDNSTAIKVIFSLLGVMLSFLIMFSQVNHVSIIELWLLWSISYLVIRYPLMELFKKTTKHRGLLHTVLMAFFSWAVVTTLMFHVLGLDDLMSWAVGFFVFLGFIVHLSLDEIYSVDFMNRRLKRSAGTALKLFGRDPLANVVFFSVTLALYWYAMPASNVFIGLLFSTDTYINVINNFLPETDWFYLFYKK